MDPIRDPGTEPVRNLEFVPIRNMMYTLYSVSVLPCEPWCPRAECGPLEQFWKLSRGKFAPRCGARAVSKSKSLKTGRFGALLEVELQKIYTTLWRESGFEVKIVKILTASGNSKRVSGGRRKDTGTFQIKYAASA